MHQAQGCVRRPAAGGQQAAGQIFTGRIPAKRPCVIESRQCGYSLKKLELRDEQHDLSGL